MAAADTVSLASAASARATPRSRRDETSIIILPKAQVLSSSSFSAAEEGPEGRRGGGGGGGVDSEQQMFSSPPPPPTTTTTTGGQVSALTGEERCEVRNNNILVHPVVPATFRELELQLEAGQQQGAVASNQNSSELRAETRQLRGDGQARKLEGHTKAFGHPERLRTVTWPSLKYKEWMDASFLSFHRLSSNYRVISSMMGQEEGGAHSRHPLSEQRRNLTSSSGAGGEAKSSSSNINNEDEFVVGAPEKWHVSSSHVKKARSCRQLDEAKSRGINDDSRAKVIELPRLPSRLGRNSLQSFLEYSAGKQSSLQIRTQGSQPRGKGQHQGAEKSRTLLLPQGGFLAGPAPLTTADAVLLPAQRARESVLRLQGCMRNPGSSTSKAHLQQQRGEGRVAVIDSGGSKAVMETSVSSSAGAVVASGASRTGKSPKGGTKKQKQLSFKIPADLDPPQPVLPLNLAADRGKTRSVSWGVQTDVFQPPIHQLKLEDAYCITKCKF